MGEANFYYFTCLKLSIYNICVVKESFLGVILLNTRTMNSVNMISLTLVALISMATTSFGGVASNSFLTASDQSRLVGIFQGALSSATDGATLHHGVKGLRALGADVADAGAVCGKLAGSLDASNLESVYYVASAGSILGCPPSVDAGMITAAISSPSSVTAMFHAVGAASALGLEIDAATALASLSALLKKDDGILAMGYSFHIASAVGGLHLLSIIGSCCYRFGRNKRCYMSL